MFDVNDDAKGGFRRVEVLTGPGRRRRWSADDKARVVAETLAVGAKVSEVARRWQVCPQQVLGWRREMRAEQAKTAEGAMVAAAPAFVPIVTEPAPPEDAAAKVAASPPIEIELGDAVVRIVPGLDSTVLTLVLRAVRASARSR
jgi:transposase